ARHSLGILKLLVARLRRAWPGVHIVLRADSGFCRWRLMRWCERHDVGYILGLDHVRLERLDDVEQAPQLVAGVDVGWL
ncbi:MAG: transposase, partial [Alphaproteobacteria bacterium]|nr:transposase [Alphaproteobacteria bacterium]